MPNRYMEIMMIPETKPCILPYTYHRLPQNRIMIIHPAGAKIIRTKTQVEQVLSGEAYPERDLTSHERIMWEQALKVIEEEHAIIF